MEVAAGNDIVAYRRQYGDQIAFRGGIDKRALARGGTTMRAELERVVPPPWRPAATFPVATTAPDIVWPDLVDYTRQLAKMMGWLE